MDAQNLRFFVLELLRRYSLSAKLTTEEREDIAQSVLLKFYQAYPDRSEEESRRVLRAMAHHEAVDFWRKRRLQRGGSKGSPVSPSLSEEESGFEERIEHEELLWKIREILEGLTPREREVLHLRFFKNCTMAEIAVRLGCSRPTVTGLLSRALTKMASQLRR